MFLFPCYLSGLRQQICRDLTCKSLVFFFYSSSNPCAGKADWNAFALQRNHKQQILWSFHSAESDWNLIHCYNKPSSWSLFVMASNLQDILEIPEDTKQNTFSVASRPILFSARFSAHFAKTTSKHQMCKKLRKEATDFLFYLSLVC